MSYYVPSNILKVPLTLHGKGCFIYTACTPKQFPKGLCREKLVLQRNASFK